MRSRTRLVLSTRINLQSVLRQKLSTRSESFCAVIYGNLTKRGNGFDVELASGAHPPAIARRRARALRRQHRRSRRWPRDGAALRCHPVSPRTRWHAGPLHRRPDRGRHWVGRERFDDRGALLRFAKSQAPVTAPAIVEAASATRRPRFRGRGRRRVLALGVPRWRTVDEAADPQAVSHARCHESFPLE